MSRKVAPKLGKLPSLEGMDIYGSVIPIHEEGGDRITWISFKDRYPLENWAGQVMNGSKDNVILPALEGIDPMIAEQIKQSYRTNLSQKIIGLGGKAGIVMTDAAGHENEGLILNAAVHQSLLSGVLAFVPLLGEVPVDLIELLNTRFRNTAEMDAHLALLYGEISDKGIFRYVAANSHAPILYSENHNSIFHLQDTHASSMPIGFALSEFPGTEELQDDATIIKPPYKVVETHIVKGDFLLLYSDGLHDHIGGGERYIERGLEQTLLATKDSSAKEICDAIKQDVLQDEREDDISYVVIKKE